MRRLDTRLRALERKNAEDDYSHLTEEQIDARIEHLTQVLRGHGIDVPDFGTDYAAQAVWARGLLSPDES